MIFNFDVWTTLQIINFYFIDVYPQEVMDGYKPLWIGLSVLCILVIFLVIDFVWLKLSRKGKTMNFYFVARFSNNLLIITKRSLIIINDLSVFRYIKKSLPHLTRARATSFSESIQEIR